MFRRFHHWKESGEVNNSRRIGVSKLDATMDEEGHEGARLNFVCCHRDRDDLTGTI